MSSRAGKDKRNHDERGTGAHLTLHTENMCIILDEPPHSRQPRQRAARLIPMNNPKLGHPDRQFLVRPVARVKDETVTRTVHRLECPFLLLDVECEHVFFVVLPVSGGFPEFGVVHVRGNDWRVRCDVVV